MAGGSTGVVAAMFASGAIAVLEFVGFPLTQSPATLSETYHPVSDTGNQVPLLVDVEHSTREPTGGHPSATGRRSSPYSGYLSLTRSA